MGYHYSCNGLLLLVSVLMVVASSAVGSFYQDFDLTWGDKRAKIFNGGQLLSLSLDRVSGSGFQSKRDYLFGRIDMQLKLVAGDSAGTVTAYYVSSLMKDSCSLSHIICLSVVTSLC